MTVTENGLRVLIADDDDKVRSALRLLLEQRADTAVVAETGRAREVAALSAATQPNVILLDWELPGECHRLMHEIQATCPGAKIVALSARPESRREAMCCGSCCFVSKNDAPEVLITTLDNLIRDLALIKPL
jgi:DNA-binding NarL/FixJ family response regulator